MYTMNRVTNIFQIIIIPLTICAYLCKSGSLYTWRPSDDTSVNRLGLGTDMWRVPFDNITSILKVRCRQPDLPTGFAANVHG